MLRDYVAWFTEKALPVWTERGFDRQTGRFRERLDWIGDPLAVPHRAMVQARQIFVFAHAANLGWSDQGASLAEAAFARLIRDFAETADGRTAFAFSIDPGTDAIVSEKRDAYAHAFVLFAIAALHRLNGDPTLLALADRVIAFVDDGLTDPAHGGLFDALPAPKEKRQNPHMHLLEAYLFLAQTAPGHGYEERAEALVQLFRARFFREGLLLEYFRHDWSVTPHRALWEPGHHFEWVWLLGEYGALTSTNLQTEMDALYRAARAEGVVADGLIADELSTDWATTKPSHRVWPHTEAIKAAATRHAEGDTNALGFAQQMAEGLLGTFLDRPFAGGWIDHVSAERTSLVDYVPASTLYHLALAASVAAKGFAGAPDLAKAGS